MNDREDVWLRVWDKHSQEIENYVGNTQIEYVFFESEEINFEWVEFNIESHAETQIDQNQNHWDCLNHILYKRFAGFEEKHTPINPIGDRDEKIQDMHYREDIW